MSLSRLAASINESPTLRLNQIAAQLKASGQSVIHLGGGEPTSRPPDSAVEAAAKFLREGEIRYGPADGIGPLKQAVLRYTERFYGRRFEPHNVIISGGAKQCIMVALHALIDPGDEVLYPAPYWVSYPEMAKLAGGVGVAARASDGGFYPTLADIESRLSPRSKLVILNSPNNPSGAMYSSDFIAGVVRLCEQRGLYLLMDDIYHRLTFDGRAIIRAYDFATTGSDDSRLIIVNGVSKQFAMTGFRIGWAVAARPIIAAMANIQSQQTSGPSMVMQHAAMAALDGDQSCVEKLRSTLESNRNVLLDKIAGIPGVKVTRPDGTFYCLADFRAIEPDSSKLAAMLLERVRVVTVPGVEFGMEGHLRISYCAGAGDVAAGLDRIRWACDPANRGAKFQP